MRGMLVGAAHRCGNRQTSFAQLSLYGSLRKGFVDPCPRRMPWDNQRVLPILVVDDHRVMAEALAGALSAEGFTVACVDPVERSIAEILEITDASSPTL